MRDVITQLLSDTMNCISGNSHKGFAILLWLFALNGHASAIVGPTAIDDTGQTITLQTPAKRIVSLAPHATELLFAAGAGPRVVGVARFSNYPESAQNITIIGDAHALDIERILRLKPDLLVAWASGTPSQQQAQARKLQIPLFLSEPHTLEHIAENIRKLGLLAGTTTEAERAATHYLQRLRALRQQTPLSPPPKVFFEIWQQPLMTVNGHHFIGQLIALCGGLNIFADLPTLTPTISPESIIKLNPDVIISGAEDTRNTTWQQYWHQWPQLNAIKHHRIYQLPSDLIARPTPRLLDAGELLCAQLRSERR